MRIFSGDFLLSATDLANHLACRHLTALDRAVAEGRKAPPSWRDPALDLLRERGLAHERGYVEHLTKEGLDVVDLRGLEGDEARERTLEAMRNGAGAIVQASLQDGRWVGRADVLLRVEEPSGLGAWSYEPVDTKLALETKGGTVLQLCLYADLTASVQGRPPKEMHVIKPGAGFPRESFRFDDFRAYFRLVRRRLESAIDRNEPDSTYPDPVPHCDVCNWWKECDERRRRDDHLCLIAGIRSVHIEELHEQGIFTLEKFAKRKKPLARRPGRGAMDTFVKIHEQAKLQLRGRKEGRLLYELLPFEEGRGLALLPEPSEGDVFFDIEADPFADEGGMEYLLGVAYDDGRGGLEYRAFRGLDRAGERQALEDFIGFVMERWRSYPEMHIYHFSPYEPAAIKRMAGRHGTCEEELDRLLRGGRFVDLLAVTRQGLRASVESYSLKEMERFFDFRRDVDLREAGAALRRVACELELGNAASVPDDDLMIVERYNRDDCMATAGLRAWLEERRAELEKQTGEIPRPELKSGDPGETVAERVAAAREVFDLLVDGLPEDRSEWSGEDRARWLLAHELEYFHREDKCVWWEYYRLQELEHEELLEERKALGGLEFIGECGGTKRCPVHRYRFPAQESDLRPGEQLAEVRGNRIGTVETIDTGRGIIDIKKRQDSADRHPAAVFANDNVSTEKMEKSLLELAGHIAGHGMEGDGRFRAARDLLMKMPPRLSSASPAGSSLRRDPEDVVDAAIRLVRGLGHGVLPIQGPPGSGKTYTGARMIAALAADGARIGVTAVSHKVIRKLLEEVLDAGRERGINLEAIHKTNRLSGNGHVGLTEVSTNDKAIASIGENRIVGGTAWLWATESATESLDYLFVDEAGQLSLAHTLAASRSARNLVLLGDPQQLEQPQQALHPEGADVAALVHILDGKKTIPDDRGLFLDVTWRLHPDICAFTSEVYYEGRLRSLPGLEKQAITGDSPFTGSGLFFVPVEHRGNSSRALEEVDVVDHIVRGLLEGDNGWTDRKGDRHELSEADILVVAPYNAQVYALSDRLPGGVAVGTVDRFQGQEAPVVIYSATSSSVQDAPRGMSFLYNPNRFNVATSRARCICILVASPYLLEPECRTPHQMRLANGLCRYREMAEEVNVSSLQK